jgi:8-oxo-dGTP pyrophosphatase MutT (NUDIX family)
VRLDLRPSGFRYESAGGVVTNDAGEVLVVSQHGTSWSLPKGHIDPGENALATARREIYEESGIRDLEFVRELRSYERHRIGVDGGDDLSELKAITMFLFRTGEKSLKPVDPDNPEAKWVEKSKVALLLTHEKDKEFFRSVEF